MVQEYSAPQTSNDWDLERFARRYLEHSKLAANDVLSWLARGENSFRSATKSPLDLITAIVTGAESEVLGRTILSLLATNGTVVSERELIPSLRTLRRRKVLILDGDKINRVASEYESALHRISVDDFGLDSTSNGGISSGSSGAEV